MSLITYKWLTATIVAITTLLAGFASLHFIRRYQRILEVGDALADGIFLGAAIFHLFPNALRSLIPHFGVLMAYVAALVLVGCGFLLLYFLECFLIQREKDTASSIHASAWMLASMLAVHAFIAGAALGISNNVADVSIILIAILAHKGFESFALAVGLHRSWRDSFKTKIILFCFAFVTPLGIVLASLVESFFYAQTADLITSFFSSFAAGTFLYIGTLHVGHDHFHAQMDARSRYSKVLATIFGIVIMGVIAIWV